MLFEDLLYLYISKFVSKNINITSASLLHMYLLLYNLPKSEGTFWILKEIESLAQKVHT